MQTDEWVSIYQAAEINGRTPQEFFDRVQLGVIHNKRSILQFGKRVYWATDAERDKSIPVSSRTSIDTP